MDQVIAITVKNKIAKTDFRELVSFNNNTYRLDFNFDDEWADFSCRIAVVVWAGGSAERIFTGTSCEMPRVRTGDAETVLVGVYSVDGDRRIASSFVRLRCRAGACGHDASQQGSLGEQILSFLNGKDWSIFEEKVAAGTYSSVSVNRFGLVTQGGRIVEIGKEGQSSPSPDLAVGGLFFKRSGGVCTPYYRTESGLEPLSLAGGGGGGEPLHIGTKDYDGSEEVTVGAADLGLAKVATTGSYSDLTDKPEVAAGVSSVNGKTGDVTLTKDDVGLSQVVTSVNGLSGDVAISKNDLGLARVALTGSYNDLSDKPSLDSAVTSVNGLTGDVTISKNDLGLARVALTGSYDDLTDTPNLDSTVTSVNGLTGEVTISKNDLGLARVALTNSYNDLDDKPNLDSAVTSVNGQTGEVTISKNDLDLARVALTGSYNDLTDKPNLNSTVTSVNGLTGEVAISKNDLGLSKVVNERQYPILEEAEGVNVNTYLFPGINRVTGRSGAPCRNVPTSKDNPSSDDCEWVFLTFGFAAEESRSGAQLALSMRSDAAVRVRTFISGVFGAWKTII